ncbi:unnamed protein product [Boreogadus saida]
MGRWWTMTRQTGVSETLSSPHWPHTNRSRPYPPPPETQTSAWAPTASGDRLQYASGLGRMLGALQHQAREQVAAKAIELSILTEQQRGGGRDASAGRIAKQSLSEQKVHSIMNEEGKGNKTGILGWRSEKTELVNGYETKVFGASNVELITRTRTDHLSDQNKTKTKGGHPTPTHPVAVEEVARSLLQINQNPLVGLLPLPGLLLSASIRPHRALWVMVIWDPAV